jgi:Methylase involved in ubiquinone/menaquinone biosynthesis
MQLVTPWVGLTNNRDLLLSSLPSPLAQRMQTRTLSVESKETAVSDEESYNCILRRRENDMHRHPAGPVARMTKLSRDAVKGGHTDEGLVRSRDLDIVDLESSPPDLIYSLARDFPNASVKSLSTSSREMQSVADDALDLHLPNVMVELSQSFDLADLEDNSIDLITSCFSLQKFTMETTERIVNEVHR